MVRLVTMGFVLLLAGLFGWQVPLDRLSGAFQPLLVALSIMVAAVFVRLNRGMPTLEWKSLEESERTRLTQAIVSLAGEYSFIVAVFAATLVLLLALIVIGPTEVALWPGRIQQGVSGVIGGLLSLCVARMAYVVWRDFDIVRLQKKLIDATGQREAQERTAALANEKIAQIKGTQLRKIPNEPPSRLPS
nr:hypothetical protein RAR13_04200 [Aminobacter aminovorans]